MGAEEKIRHFLALVTQPDEFTGAVHRYLTIPGTLAHSAMPFRRGTRAKGNKFGHLQQRNSGGVIGPLALNKIGHH